MSVQHWEDIHSQKHMDVSWWQDPQALWFDLVEFTNTSKDEPVIDVGGGASLLVDELLHHGFTDVTLLDIAQSALDRTKQRLDDKIHYLHTNVTTLNSTKKFALWHDRAVLHFLTTEAEQSAYRTAVHANVKNHGHVILCTFADDGPQQCSGLNVQRYSEDELAQFLGPEFSAMKTERRIHTTPWGSEQKFVVAVLKRN